MSEFGKSLLKAQSKPRKSPPAQPRPARIASPSMTMTAIRRSLPISAKNFWRRLTPRSRLSVKPKRSSLVSKSAPKQSPSSGAW